MAGNKRWTKHEDKIVTYTMMAHIVMGKTMNGAYEELAKELNRSIDSIRYRWRKDLKPLYADKISILQDTINKNGQKASTFKKWTNYEELMLKNTVRKYLKQGKTIEDALKYFGKKQGRTYKSVYNKWYQSVR